MVAWKSNLFDFLAKVNADRATHWRLVHKNILVSYMYIHLRKLHVHTSSYVVCKMYVNQALDKLINRKKVPTLTRVGPTWINTYLVPSAISVHFKSPNK